MKTTGDYIRVHEAVLEAPGTAPEIALELGIGVKLVSAHLGRLHNRGLVERVLVPELQPNRGRKPYLYRPRA